MYCPTCPQHVISGCLNSMKFMGESGWECGRLFFLVGTGELGGFLCPSKSPGLRTCFLLVHLSLALGYGIGDEMPHPPPHTEMD